MTALNIIPLFPSPDRVKIEPGKRGWSVVYRRNEINRCPACGRAQWFVGRHVAECAFERCGAVIPLQEMGL